MKTLVAIPSKNRIDILKANALKWLEHIEADWKVFVEPQDYRNYVPFLASHSEAPTHIVALMENNRGLGYSKQSIKDYAKAHGYDLIFKVDDDISGWTDFRKVLKGKEGAAQFNKNLKEIVEAFEKHPQLAVVSFPYSFQMFEEFQFKKTKRVQTAYITRVEDFHADPAISVFEDFSVGLNAIVQGKLVLYYGSGISMGVKVGGGEGGHQSFDRQERAMKEIEELRKIYPPLGFRKVDKIWGYEPDLKSVKIGLYL